MDPRDAIGYLLLQLEEIIVSDRKVRHADFQYRCAQTRAISAQRRINRNREELPLPPGFV